MSEYLNEDQWMTTRQFFVDVGAAFGEKASAEVLVIADLMEDDKRFRMFCDFKKARFEVISALFKDHKPEISKAWILTFERFMHCKFAVTHSLTVVPSPSDDPDKTVKIEVCKPHPFSPAAPHIHHPHPHSLPCGGRTAQGKGNRFASPGKNTVPLGAYLWAQGRFGEVSELFAQKELFADLFRNNPQALGGLEPIGPKQDEKLTQLIFNATLSVFGNVNVDMLFCNAVAQCVRNHRIRLPKRGGISGVSRVSHVYLSRLSHVSLEYLTRFFHVSLAYLTRIPRVSLTYLTRMQVATVTSASSSPASFPPSATRQASTPARSWSTQARCARTRRSCRRAACRW